MSSFTAYARICELIPSEKGYTRLTVAVNIPFKLKLFKFNVWDEALLKTELMEPFKVGDEVKVSYNYKKTFPNLLEMTLSSLDTCPVCFAYLEAADAQRMDCPGCSTVPETDHKIRLNVEMKLTSCDPKEYLHTIGYRLTLHCEEEGMDYVSVIFPNNLLYNTIKDLKVNQNYFVIGWKSLQGHLLDVVDIY